MKQRQKTAFFNPCFFVSQVESTKVCRLDKQMGKWTVDTALTINAFGGGVPCWQASAKVLSPMTKRPVNIHAKLTPAERVRVATYLKRLLEGVGVGKVIDECTMTSLSYLKCLSPGELRGLPERRS